MNKAQSILYIYDDLINWKDFEVFQNWEEQLIKWHNKEIKQPSQAELETAWIEVEKEIKTKEINTAFQSKIDNYLSKYPQAEIDRFTWKKIESQKVIDWGESYYITKKAEALWITALQYATAVHTKAETYEEFYIECENERDLALNSL